MKALPLLALLPLSLMAQNPNPSGVYKAKSLSNSLELRLLDNGTYEFIATSGKYTAADKKILFSSDVKSFIVEKTQGDSNQLEINFKTMSAGDADPRYIYIGYENDKGEVNYVCLYNKINSTDYIEEKKDSDGDTYYALDSFEVPRTANLYLAVVQSLKTKSVNIQKFAVGKNTNAVDITILGGPSSLKLNGTYNPNKETISLSEEGSPSAILFTKVTGKENPNEVALANNENVKNWPHFIDFEKERDIPEYNPDKKAKDKEKSTISISKTLAAALASAAKNNRLVVVFQQTDNKEAKEQFDTLFRKYKEQGSGYDYSEEEQKAIYTYEFYLATAKDLKTLKAKGIPAGNQMAVLDAAGDLLYTEETTVAKVEMDETLTSDANVAQFNTMASARALDRVLGNPKASIKDLETAFTNFLKKDNERVYLIAKNRPKGETQDAEDQFDYIQQEKEDYFSTLSNPNAIYQMQLTLEQVEAQWARIVNAHKKDSKLDPAYAFLLSLNTTDRNFFYRIFAVEKFDAPADIDAIAYLVKFSDEIKAHNEKLNKKDDNEYIGYRERLERGDIEVNYGSLSTQLDRLVFNDEKTFFEPVKAVYIEGVRKKVFSADDYIDFLYENNIDEVSAYFAEYYKNILQKDNNLIAALDKAFSENDNDESWKYYKMRFANRANNIAWKVYEEHKNNPDALSEPFQWATSAVQLEPENAYYLDTLAHLMYARGDKQKAIETQEKALKSLPKAEYGSDEEREQIKTNLNKMKRGEI